jgi:hypothetical protein
MNLRKVAGLLLAGIMTAGLSVALAQPAQAAPDPGTSYEIFDYFHFAEGPKCVDVPGGSSRPGQLLQVFHCVSGTNQLWFFDDQGNGYFQIRNVKSHLCFELPSLSTRIEQASCVIPFDTEQYRIQVVFTTPAGQNVFGLVNKAFPDQCLTILNGGAPVDNAPIGLAACQLGTSVVNPGNAAQLWALG